MQPAQVTKSAPHAPRTISTAQPATKPNASAASMDLISTVQPTSAKVFSAVVPAYPAETMRPVSAYPALTAIS